MNQRIFYSPTMGELNEAKMLAEISNFAKEDMESFYRLVIGTDSHTRRNGKGSEVSFVTAVVIHRMGTGARYFWKKDGLKKQLVLREKIYMETMKSLETARELVPQIHKVLTPSKYDLEIHIDVGQNGPTREMIREVVGMVTGNGFTAKTKPESWAASSVADKHS